MSLLYGQAIREQLAMDIRAAWPDVKQIVFGQPVGEPPKTPYARVDMAEVEYGTHTVNQTEQRYVYIIGLVAPLRQGAVVADLQEAAANQLIARLMSSTLYSEVPAHMPHVNRVLFGAEYNDEPTYEVGIEFECRVSVPYLTSDPATAFPAGVAPVGGDPPNTEPGDTG